MLVIARSKLKKNENTSFRRGRSKKAFRIKTFKPLNQCALQTNVSRETFIGIVKVREN